MKRDGGTRPVSKRERPYRMRRLAGEAGEYGVACDASIGDDVCLGVIARLEKGGALPHFGPAPLEREVALDGTDYFVWISPTHLEIYQL